MTDITLPEPDPIPVADFDDPAICPKCMHEQADGWDFKSLEVVSAAQFSGIKPNPKVGDTLELLLITCARCRFAWYMETA